MSANDKNETQTATLKDSMNKLLQAKKARQQKGGAGKGSSKNINLFGGDNASHGGSAGAAAGGPKRTGSRGRG